MHLLQCVQSGARWSVDLYLRILLAIDSEVVDRQVVHSQEVSHQKHSTFLLFCNGTEVLGLCKKYNH